MTQRSLLPEASPGVPETKSRAQKQTKSGPETNSGTPDNFLGVPEATFGSFPGHTLRQTEKISLGPDINYRASENVSDAPKPIRMVLMLLK